MRVYTAPGTACTAPSFASSTHHDHRGESGVGERVEAWCRPLLLVPQAHRPAHERVGDGAVRPSSGSRTSLPPHRPPMPDVHPPRASGGEATPARPWPRGLRHPLLRARGTVSRRHAMKSHPRRPRVHLPHPSDTGWSLSLKTGLIVLVACNQWASDTNVRQDGDDREVTCPECHRLLVKDAVDRCRGIYT